MKGGGVTPEIKGHKNVESIKSVENLKSDLMKK